MNNDVSELENILTKLVNEFQYGYGFIKNSRDLLEQLTEYKANNPDNKLKVILQISCKEGDAN